MNALHPTPGSLVYLATPIKAMSDVVLHGRYIANKVAVNTLITAGQMVYSPMLHWYIVKHDYNWPMTWSFWERPSFCMLDRCDAILLLKLPGWEDSVGVDAEVRRAVHSGKLIFEMTDPATMDSVRPLDWSYWLLKSNIAKSASDV